MRGSIERGLVATPTDKRTKALLREIRKLCHAPEGTDRALAAALRAHQIVWEDKIRAWKGHPPTIEWGRLMQQAQMLLINSAAPTADEPAQPRKKTWEELVDEARGTHYSTRRLGNSRGSQLDIETGAEPGETSTDSSEVGADSAEEIAPDAVEPAGEPAVIIDGPAIPRFERGEEEALRDRLREVEAILARPQGTAPRSSWEERDGLNREAAAIWLRLNRRREQPVEPTPCVSAGADVHFQRSIISGHSLAGRLEEAPQGKTPLPAERRPMERDSPASQDAQAFIASLDEVDLSRFCVVGTYTRYDEAVRNTLQDVRQKILAGFEPPGRRRENHLIWAAPGTGKTYFVQQVAASIPSGIRYHELNLAKCTEAEFRSGLAALNDRDACLCLVDEVDAKPQEPWPYEVLLPYLDAAVERGARFVFVLAGSSGTSLEEIKQRIGARPKGTDLLSRIPTGHEYVIGPMSLGDRLLIVLSQLRQAGVEAGREIRAIEKFGLYYVALNPRFANARQLREFAVRAVERVPKSDDRVKYDHLFVPGDPENKAFWVQASPVADGLVNTFVILGGDRLAAMSHGASVSTLSPAQAASSPAAAIEARPRTNLPRQLTSFIGRAREIEEVKRLLPSTALLTLHGPGGCGKTRLAFRVAADLVDQYPDGVWVTELAPLSDPSLVPKVVATALDVPEQPGRALTETLKESLRRKSLLLVLDSCEHLLSACAELADSLLKASPTLRILATSREPLNIPGEVVWGVPSLSIPEPNRLPGFANLEQFDAVRLFVERAATSKPGFTLTSINAPAVAQVCSQLEGIPLAIELAAARVKVLAVEQIAARLNDRFRLLTGGSPVALTRHQTLRSAIDWSYNLLIEPERVLLGRIAVFAGGWTLDAAETVCAGAPVKDGDMVDLLASLVDKSLVSAETLHGDARYRMLETLRQYAHEKLEATGDAATLRRFHSDWCLRLAEEARSHLTGPATATWLRRLEREHDNFRAALGWSASEGRNEDWERAMRLAVALAAFWEIRSHFTEGRRWLEALIGRSEAAPPLLRAAALNEAGVLAYRQGDYPRVSALCSEALALCEVQGDKRGAGRSLHFLAHLKQARGDYAGATATMERSIALHREAGEPAEMANSVDCLGEIARTAGDYDRARAAAEEALALYSNIGHVRGRAHLIHNLGYLKLRDGDAAEAKALFLESLTLARELGDLRDVAFAVVGLACASVGEAKPARLTRLLGAAEALLKMVEIRLEPAEDAEFRRAVEAARAGVDSAAFAAANAEGRAMTLEQAIEYALAAEAN